MGYSKSEVALLVAVVVMAAMMVGGAEGAISCGTVSSDVSQCTSYLTGGAQSPSSACCAGVNTLYTATKSSRPDRITACGCLNTLAKALGSKLSASNAGSLPGKCGVSLGYTPSLSVNCNTIP